MPKEYILCLLVLFHELNEHLSALSGKFLADLIFVGSVCHNSHAVVLTYLVLAVHASKHVFLHLSNQFTIQLRLIPHLDIIIDLSESNLLLLYPSNN
jgi:hypothetical protein